MKIVVCCLFCFILFGGLLAQQDSIGQEKTWTQRTVEVQPEFPGCEVLKNDQSFEECQRRGITHFLVKNMDLPSVPDSVAGFSGMIVAFAIVDKQDGHLRNPEIIRSIYPSYDQAFLDVILKMPNWKPGTVSGEKVDVQMVFHTKVYCCH